MATAPGPQLLAQAQRVEQALGRPLTATRSSPRTLGYRSRISLNTDASGRLGYHRPRSHEHTPVPSCAIAHPRLSALLDSLPPCPQGVARVELRTDGSRVVWSGQSHASLHSGRRRRLPASRVVQGAVQTQDLLSIGLTGVALDGRTLAGEPWIEIEVAGISHRLGPLTFFQVNAEVNALLVRRVRDWVLSRHPTQVLDLFSGAGNLSLPLAKAQVPLVALESNPRAIDDLRATAARHDLQVDARVTDARDVRAGQFFFDVAILDPPRKGAGRLLEQLVLTRPTAIAYLSCNPRALARELPLALDAGYRIAALELFEMFPHTHHTEVLCLLERDRT